MYFYIISNEPSEIKIKKQYHYKNTKIMKYLGQATCKTYRLKTTNHTERNLNSYKRKEKYIVFVGWKT